MMQDSVPRMSGIIDNVMDLARGRLGGGIELNRRTSRWGRCSIRWSRNCGSPSGTRDRVAFHLTAPVNCDRSRVAQLFSNLLGNALLYGRPTRRCGAGSDAGWNIQVSVANAGEQISPAALERLFQPFARGDVRPNQQGLGLGLYIASEIARAHDGTIDVTSTAAETRFTFRMPSG